MLWSMVCAAVDGRGCGGGWCSGWWLVGVVAAFWVAAGGSGGVTGAEPVAGIPGLIPGFATVAGIPGLIPGVCHCGRNSDGEAGIGGAGAESVAGAAVDGRCCGRWPVLPSMAGGAVDGLCCGRWPVLWRRLVFRC